MSYPGWEVWALNASYLKSGDRINNSLEELECKSREMGCW